MSSLDEHLLEVAERNLRQVEREVWRKMRSLRQQLQQLQEELPLSCPRSPCCPHLPDPPCPLERRALAAGLDLQREFSSMQRKLNRVLDSSCDDKLLALVDVEGFVPEEVTVTVEDGKVKVLAEHEEERTTTRGKVYNYKNIKKEINLPPGVSEDEVTYSLGCNNVLKIKTEHKRHPCLPNP